MTPETLKKYAAPVPRYTSYPSAPHFSNAIGAEAYRTWLGRIAAGTALSLYVHVPFCDTLCWYCGCNTKVTRRYEPVAKYLEALLQEIETVGKLVPKEAGAVRHIHFGGGSPSVLEPADIARLAAALKSAFPFAADVDFAVEVDPRGLDEARMAAFAAAGVTRVSIGVQDFEEKVQDAINRQQSFESTRDVIEGFRAHGVPSINVDLVYGLPHQSVASVTDTIGRVIGLRPDRIALFGYAHLPARLVHQRLIDEAALPDSGERFAQAQTAARLLIEAGYVQVGLDHFALPHDSLASGGVRRNFQGYTADQAPVLIGLGASSIGRNADGYVQNATAIAEYERRVAEGGLATVRGHQMTREDEIRSYVIERLMCDFRFSATDLTARFGADARPLIAEAEALVKADHDGILLSEDDGFRVSEEGRIFVRTICSAFDSYLGTREVRHSAGV